MDASRTIGRSAARPGRPDIHFYVARPRSASGKGIRLFRKEEEEDQLAADLVLVVPEAGVDRVEWAKQLVHNAVRSPYTQQATRMPSNNSFRWRPGPAS